MAATLSTEEAIFYAALEIQSADQRSAYLDVACANQPDLRQRIEALLLRHGEAAGPLDRPGLALPATRGETVTERPGTIIGPYKLLEQIGEGGFGVVFMAEQQEPIRRKVALKVLKPGMDTRQIIARFEAERQALALMDHPNIAKVLDAGETACGRPFFVMELVRGVPMTQYCDQARLPPKERLQLFVSVCQAIQHAHQKGIIHRDVKPTNVLVTMSDGKPLVKVIDFGIAKATGGQLTDKTLFTNFAQMIGTPLYMSPEQAGLSAEDVDTRSDIYSLGVLLYELLTGTTPFTRERFKKAAFDEIRRIIREEEPPRPSTRLSESKDSLPSISAQRQIEPAKLTRLVRGELDWIVMKALEKDRNRRYETANGFAMDLQRYLGDEPVLACPPSASYRLKKFVQRNKGPVVAAAAIALALVAGAAVSIWQAVRATRAEATAVQESNEKEQARRDAVASATEAKDQKLIAEEKAAVAKALNDFLVDDLLLQANTSAQADRRLTAEPNLTVREAVDRAAARIGNRFQNQPVVEAAVRHAIGEAYEGVGEGAKAIEHLRRAVELLQSKFGDDHQDTLTAKKNLGTAYTSAGQFALAIPLLEESFRVCRAKFGESNYLTLAITTNLASAYSAAGQFSKALSLNEQTLALRKANFGHDEVGITVTMNNLAAEYGAVGKPEKAVLLYEQVVPRWREQLGPEHPQTLTAMNNLAMSYKQAGKAQKAIAIYKTILPLLQARMGADHPNTLWCMNNLASAYAEDRQMDLAVPLQEKALQLTQAKLGMDHPQTLTNMSNLALDYLDTGRLDEARVLTEKTLEIRKTKLGPDHPHTLQSMRFLADVLNDLGQYYQAIPLNEEVLRRQKASIGPNHPDTLITLNNLAHTYRSLGQYERALPLFKESLEGTKSALGLEHPDTVLGMQNLALTYIDLGQLDVGTPLADETLRLHNATVGANHPFTLDAMRKFARSYQKQGQDDRALALFEEALKRAKAAHGADDPRTLTAMHFLAMGYLDAGKLDQALPLAEKTLQLRKTILGPEHADTLNSVRCLALVYRDLRKPDLAVPLFEQVLKLRTAARGADSLTALHSTYELGRAQLDAGKPDLALPLLERAYEGAKPQQGPVHPNTFGYQSALIDAYAQTGRLDRQAEVLNERVAAFRQKWPAGSPALAATLARLGDCQLRQQQYTEAEKTMKECLAFRQEKEPDEWSTFNAQSMLGGALLGQKKYGEAEPLLLKGYEGMNERAAKIPPQSKTNLNVALERLVQLYVAWEKPDQAAEWRKKIEEQKRH